MSRFAAFALGLAVVSLAHLARAQEAIPSRVLILVDASDAATGATLLAELRALGFEGVVREPTASIEPAALDDETRAAGAVATLRVRRSPEGVEVWVNDRVTGKTTLREVVEPKGSHPNLIATRAVELLRASLLELALPDAPRGDVATTPAVEALAAERPARWFLGLHGGANLSPGGLGPAGFVAVDATFRPHDHLAAELWVAAPVAPVTIEGEEGSASVVTTMAGLGGVALVAPPASRWNFYGGPRFGFAWLHLEGSAQVPYIGQADDIVAPALFFSSGAYVAITRAVRIAFDADVVWAFTEPTIRFAGREVASWGAPAVLAGAGIEVGLD